MPGGRGAAEVVVGFHDVEVGHVEGVADEAEEGESLGAEGV